MDMTQIIREPGKFEGEPLYVRELWELGLEGGASETVYDGETPVDVFILTDGDRESYKLDADDYAILLWESETGFVNSRVMTETQFDDFIDSLTDDLGDDDDDN